VTYGFTFRGRVVHNLYMCSSLQICVVVLSACLVIIIFLFFLFYAIMFLYGLSSMLWCTLQFPHNNNVGGLMSYLRYLCLLGHRVVEQIYCCVFLRIVYSMLPVSLYCSFLIAPSVFSTVYISWIVHLWLSLRYSLPFIYYWFFW
jgi:hypothetical protein